MEDEKQDEEGKFSQIDFEKIDEEQADSELDNLSDMPGEDSDGMGDDGGDYGDDM